MVHCSNRITDCNSHSPALLDLLVSSDPSMWCVPQWLSLHWKKSKTSVAVSGSIAFSSNSKGHAPFHHWYDYSCVDWRVFVIIWELFHERISLNSKPRQLLLNFVSRLRLELLYISFTANIRSSLIQPMVFYGQCCCHGSKKPLL